MAEESEKRCEDEHEEIHVLMSGQYGGKEEGPATDSRERNAVVQDPKSLDHQLS